MLGSHVVAEGILADKKQGNHQIEKNPLNTVLARIGGDVNDVRGHDRRDPDRGPLADQPEKSLGALELFPLVKAQENLQRMILVCSSPSSGIVSFISYLPQMCFPV